MRKDAIIKAYERKPMYTEIKFSGTLSLKELLMCLETYRSVYGDDTKIIMSALIEPKKSETK